MDVETYERAMRGQGELPRWDDVARDPALVDPRILQQLRMSMCFMVRDESGPVAALIARASPDEFRAPLSPDIPMSLYVHPYVAPTCDLYGVYPIIWDDPGQPQFKETWMIGAGRVTGPADPLSEGELARLEKLLTQEYTYFLVVDRSNRPLAARRVDYSPQTQKHFLNLLPKVRAARAVTVSNVDVTAAVVEYSNRVSTAQIVAAAQRLRTAQPVRAQRVQSWTAAPAAPVKARSKARRGCAWIMHAVVAFFFILCVVAAQITAADYARGITDERLTGGVGVTLISFLSGALMALPSILLAQRRRRTFVLWVAVALTALIACTTILAPATEERDILEIAFGPTPRPTPRPTLTRPPAVAGRPTSTPAPTPTATPLPTATPTPLPVQAPGWGGVTLHTLCLAVEQSYPGIEGKIPDPIAETAQRILAAVGLLVASDGVSCDANLIITLTGEALHSEYSGGQTCYSGAEMQGQVLLTDPEGRASTLSVSEKLSPPFFVSRCAETPVGAPFRQVYPGALLDGLAPLWGPQVLVRALQDENANLRKAAAEALGAVGAKDGVVAALCQGLEDEETQVRQTVAEALLEIGPAAVEAVPALTRALEDEYSLVRETVAAALGVIGPEAVEAAPALVEALADEGYRVRAAAAGALGKIGPQALQAVPGLIQAVRDENDDVSVAAAQSLRAISGQDYGRDADRWQQWWEQQ